MHYVMFRTCLAVLCGLVPDRNRPRGKPSREEEPAAAMGEGNGARPATGKMVSAPEYGGDIDLCHAVRASEC